MLKKYSFYQKNKTGKGKSLCVKNLTGNLIFLVELYPKSENSY